MENKNIKTKGKYQKIEKFSSETISRSANTKVKEIIRRLEDKSFVERIRSYSETYWDQAWSAWAPPSILRHEESRE